MIILIFIELFHVVLHKYRRTQHVVHRNVKETLDLRRVEVHSQHPVCPSGNNHVGHQLGGDGVPAFRFPVLTGIAKVGHHGGDPSSGGPAEGVHHNEQFHQVIVDRVAGGLYHKHVATTDRLIDGYGDLAIGKLLDLAEA